VAIKSKIINEKLTCLSVALLVKLFSNVDAFQLKELVSIML